MKFGDIVALAKQGYTPADIKELLALSEDTQTDNTEEVEQKTVEEGQQNEQTEVIDQPAEKTDDVDYKQLFEEEKQKTTRLQKIITSADMSTDNTESDADIFASVMKDFM